ncbi:MAG: branched-chain amino acid ABC transporter permease [Chloroflexota bacterium]
MAVVRTNLQWGILVAFLLLLFALPLFLPAEYIYLAIYISVGIIAALGLNILTGFCGQISIGQAAFMGVGAFSAGILISRFQIPFWFAVPIAGITAGLVGLFFGIPSLRVKGLYLALATLAAQFIIHFVLVHFFGGDTGVHVKPPSLGPLVFATDRSFYYIALVSVILFTFLAKNIVRTRVGRAFIAIRDNDIAAEVMGIDIFRYKLLAFFIGCFFAGVAGALWATYMGLASVEHYTLLESVWLLGMIVVGGMGSIAGTIFGVVFIRVVEYLTQLVAPTLGTMVPALSGNLLSALEILVFSLIILLFLIFEPRGLAHRWEIFKASYRLHPWAH